MYSPRYVRIYQGGCNFATAAGRSHRNISCISPFAEPDIPKFESPPGWMRLRRRNPEFLQNGTAAAQPFRTGQSGRSVRDRHATRPRRRVIPKKIQSGGKGILAGRLKILLFGQPAILRCRWTFLRGRRTRCTRGHSGRRRNRNRPFHRSTPLRALRQ